jgi:hypothetical protein
MPQLTVPDVLPQKRLPLGAVMTGRVATTLKIAADLKRRVVAAAKAADKSPLAFAELERLTSFATSDSKPQLPQGLQYTRPHRVRSHRKGSNEIL